MNEKRRIYGVKISEDDLLKINLWCNKNGYQVSWLIRRLIKEFIKKNIDETIKIEPEVVNSGASKENRGTEWIKEEIK